MLDVFSGDAFGFVSLTASINKLPYKPGRLGAMGLFTRKSITTLTAEVEEQHGKLALIPNLPRGVQTTLHTRTKRHARILKPAHLPVNDQLLADDVQNVRAFGSETATETVAEVVNNLLQEMRQNIEITVEYHRIGAIQGVILDADGTTEILDLFTEFGIVENVVDFNAGVGPGIKGLAQDTIDVIEDVLGAAPYDHVHALCGATFYKNLVTNDEVIAANELPGEGAFAREQQRRGIFFGDIFWEPYRGKVGSVDFIPAAEARAFPVGVPDLFQEIYAPANFVETVNTPGKPVYAKQELLKFGIGVGMHAQSNPLTICTRPGALVKLT